LATRMLAAAAPSQLFIYPFVCVTEQRGLLHRG